MRSLYKITLLIFCVSSPLRVDAQVGDTPWEHESVMATDLSILAVNLYRGWVELLPSNGDSIEIEYSTYDYDHYNATHELIPFLKERRRTRPNISSGGNKLTIENGVSREIIGLKIKVPRHLSIVLNINHLGIVSSRNIKGEQEISAFSGQVDLEGVSSASSVHIVRDGSINVSYDALQGQTYSAFSIYDGDINIMIPEASNVTLDVSTDLGGVTDEFELNWKLSKPKKFSVKSSSGLGEEMTSYTRKAQLGDKGSQFLIRNIQGDINIKKRQ